jgi:glycosyltransferase involved in cell wall biosynthesis
MAKIDVVMPVRDGAETLPSAIASILGQTAGDLRLIIVDDGSAGETLAVIERFREQDRRVDLVASRGKGIVDALNTGLDRADGAFLARMDGDDIAFPARFAVQQAAMTERAQASFCGSSVIRFGGENGLVRVPVDSAACRTALRAFNCFYHPTVLIRRDVLERHGLRYRADYQYAEDYKLFRDLADVGECFNIAEPLLLYRVHAGQTSLTKQKAQNRAALDVVANGMAGGGAGATRDARALAAMVRAGAALGRPHARRSLNALKNSLSATVLSLRGR